MPKRVNKVIPPTNVPLFFENEPIWTPKFRFDDKIDRILFEGEDTLAPEPKKLFAFCYIDLKLFTLLHSSTKKSGYR